MTATARWLWSQDEYRRCEVELNMRRYNQRGMRGLFPTQAIFPDRDNIRVNITKAVIETLVAKVGSNRPRPKLLTNGAKWGDRRRAKDLQKFLDAVFKANNISGLTKEVFRDALLCGTGIMYIYPNLGKRQATAERVFPLEIVVDPAESLNGTPTNLYRTKFLDRQTLKGMFPEYSDEIDALPAADINYLPLAADEDPRRSQSMVQVWESWHLATFDYKGNRTEGRHVLACENLLLCCDEWCYDYFPFSFFHWNGKPLRGFWADSAAAEVRGYERECNKLLQKAQRAMSIAGQPWILAPESAKVKPAKLTNETGLIIEYKGQVPPTIQVHQPIHPGILEQAWTLQQKAFQQLGTNEYQTAGVKPAGIESGRGLEQLSEEHLIRFKAVSQDLEQFVAVDLSRQFLRAAAELDEALKAQGVKKGYVVKSSSGKTWLEIEWDKAYVSPDDLAVEVWPTSVLPISPAGRTEEVERWQANKWVTPEQAMDLLDFPDLESETNLQTADVELVEYQLEKMLDDGDDVQPEEIQNLAYAKKRVAYAIEFAVQNGCPESNIDKARTFLFALDALVPAQGGPQDMAMAGGPPVSPMGPAGPVSPASQPMPAGGPMVGPAGGGF
jgi:hypothetical protein